MLGGDAHAVTADGGGNSVDSLVLTHDVAAQPVSQLGQTLELLFPDAAGGDLGPQLDDPGDVLHGQFRQAALLQFRKLRLQAHLLAPQLGDPGIARVHVLALGVGAHERLALKGHILQILSDFHPAVDTGVLQIKIRAGLVNEVDGLVGQETVGDVALGEHHRLSQHALGDLHAVMLLIVVGDTAQDLQRVLDVGLIHRHGLEAALQRRVLFNVLAVLVEGGGADHLDLAAAQGRL